MEFKELKNKSESELQKLLAEARNQILSLRFKDASRQLKDVREIRETRKGIARIMTALKSAKKAN